MKAIDTHAHLDFPQFDADRDELIAALQVEQIGVINIATDFESNQRVVALSDRRDLMWAAIGIHPTEVNASSLTQLDGQLSELKELASNNNKIVAIGEVGLDYHREESKAHAETQIAVLRAFLTLAGELDLPVIFHCRDAYGDLQTILADYPKTRGVIHCFTGTADEAGKFLNLGLNISFTATITYPANEEQRAAVAAVPLERIFLETDSPYLVPQDRRGQRNDPRTIFGVARAIAEIKNLTEEEILRQTTVNAINFFRLGAQK